MLLSSFTRALLQPKIKINDLVKILSFARHFSGESQSIIVRSKISSVPIQEVSLNEYVWKNLDKWHDKTALVCAETGRSYLYKEVYTASLAIANFLHQFNGIIQGDAIAIVLPNIPEYPIILLGAVRAGLKVTPVNPHYTSDEIAKQLLNSNTKIIFTLPELWSNVHAATKMESLNRDIPIVVVNHKLSGGDTPAGAIKFNEISTGNREELQIEQNFEDVIVLPYSSGTTGIPKGVQLTNKNIVANLHQLDVPEMWIFNKSEGHDQDTTPAVLPMFHIFGLTVVTLQGLACGCKLVTVPKFGSEVFRSVLEEHRPTAAYLVPPIILMLLNNPSILPRHIAHLKTIISGAAPLGAADVERLHQKSGGKTTLLQGYGLTETSPTTHQQSAVLPNSAAAGSCGIIMPNTECKIVALDDETKTGLGPHQSGELYIRGPQVMKGYHNNPRATADVLNEEGWFRTGDIAHYDEHGQFFITDRLKELIKVKGFQVAPAELEELLRNHPDVEDAAVVGVPHADFGEVPRAFIVPRHDSVRIANIHDYMDSKTAKHKHLIGGIVALKSIPKSAAGKILRRQLKNL